MPKKKKELKTLTKLEREKELKKQIAEDEEKLTVLGQESDTKAAKWIMEEQKEEDKKQDEEDLFIEEKLHSSRRKVFTYKDALLQYMIKLKNSYDVPRGYLWGIKSTQKGLALFIRDKKGQWFGKGTKVCGTPKYDINAVQRLVFNGLDYMDRLEEQSEKGRQTNSGIILPN